MPRDDLDVETEVACAAAQRLVGAGLLAQLLRAAARRPGPGGDRPVPAGAARRPAPTASWSPRSRCAALLERRRRRRAQRAPRALVRRRRRHAAGARRRAARRRRLPWPSASSTCPAPRCSCAPTAPRAGRGLIPNLATALVLGLSLGAVRRWCCCWRATCAGARAAEARAGRGAGLSQGDGGLARHRPARARPARPHHLRQPGVLRDGRLLAPTSCVDARDAAVLAAGDGRRVHAAASASAWRGSARLQRAREGFETIFMRQNGERFPVMIYEAPLVDGAGPPHRLDERRARRQRAAPRRGAVAPAAGAPAGHARGWRRSARWPRC